MVSNVENLCILAHSKRLLRVLPVDILVSLTIVHVPHSGHFIGAPCLAPCLWLPLCAKSQYQALPPQFAI